MATETKQPTNCPKWDFDPDDCPLIGGPECPCTCQLYDEPCAVGCENVGHCSNTEGCLERGK